MSANGRGQLIFLTGPAASGKTRTGMLWSLQRATPTFFLDWDQVANVLLVEEALHTLTVSAAYRRSAQVCAALAKSITNEGNDCILVGSWALDPNPDWEGQWSDVRELDPLVVVLHPSLETCLERNRADASRRGRFAVPEAHIKGSHRLDWGSWSKDPRALVVDTSALGLEEVVSMLEQLVQEARPFQR
jgi:hypothetical protein